jgi:uracil-DNA glycosylase
MELSPEQRAALLSLARSARAQLETELELGLNGLPAALLARPAVAPARAPASSSSGALRSPAPAPPRPIAPQPPAPRSTPPGDRLRILQALQADAATCTGCVLHEKRTQSVFSRGSADAELVFVGEGPGRDEDLQGLPFVGAAGQLLDKMITAMGYGRDDVYICNVVKCRPPENRTPLPEEAAACSRFLVPQIDAVSPKMIVALGRCAAQALGVAGETGAWRGRWGSFRGVEVMPTYHPAYLLRSPEQKRTVWADLQLVMGRLGKTPKAPRS